MLMLKTILDEVLGIQNNHGQGKCYQPQPLASADNTSETLIFPDITKTQSDIKTHFKKDFAKMVVTRGGLLQECLQDDLPLHSF